MSNEASTYSSDEGNFKHEDLIEGGINPTNNASLGSIPLKAASISPAMHRSVACSAPPQAPTLNQYPTNQCINPWQLAPTMYQYPQQCFNPWQLAPITPCQSLLNNSNNINNNNDNKDTEINNNSNINTATKKNNHNGSNYNTNNSNNYNNNNNNNNSKINNNSDINY